MPAKKIWTSQHVRVALAAYAESGRRDLDKIAADIKEKMALPGAVFYKLEHESVFVGYQIEAGGQVIQTYIRPHLKQFV